MWSGIVVAVAALGGAVVFDWVLMAFLWRLKRGQLRVERDDAHSFSVKTDFGRYWIDRRCRQLRATAGGAAVTADIGEISRVDLSLREEGAFLFEWLHGLDLWDLFGRYRDATEWYEVSLLLRGQRIPFFTVGQYVPREPLSAWYFEFQARTLARIGLFRSARETAVEAMESLEQALRQEGWQPGALGAREMEPRRPTRR